MLYDAVDEVVLLRLLRAHEVIAVGVVGDLLERLAGVLGEDLIEAFADVDDLFGVDLDVGRLSLEAGGNLVDEDLRVGQRHPLAGGTAGEEQGAHAHRDADADRLHVGLDELHRVVDRQARVDRAAGRVDVKADVLVRILGLQVQELGHDQVGDVLGDLGAEEDDALVQQARVDVERALAARGLLDNHWDKRTHGRDSIEAQSSGVQSSAFSSLCSFSGVQIFSRASACSSGIGLAESATTSIALRTWMSSRTIASRPFSRSRSSSFSGVVRSCSAVCSSASIISSSETSIPSASATAASTASRFSSSSASGFASSMISSRVLPCICR